MNLIGILVKTLVECSAPELKINRKIVKREEGFNNIDPNRRGWMLENTYLCTGGLEQLKQEENYPTPASSKLTYYPDYKRYKAVRVTVKGLPELAERRLKEALYLRGCNAGVFYSFKTKEGVTTAKAVPAMISQE